MTSVTRARVRASAGGHRTAAGRPGRPRPAGHRGTRHQIGFWLVAYAFTVTMAFSAVPTPLYVLYQARDGFGSVTLTLIFAMYAVGVGVFLLLGGALSGLGGPRAVLGV